MTEDRITQEGPTLNQNRIIALELAVTDYQGREHELQMFPCSHTLDLMDYRYGGQRHVRVTLHCTNGDITLNGIMA